MFDLRLRQRFTHPSAGAPATEGRQRRLSVQRTRQAQFRRTGQRACKASSSPPSRGGSSSLGQAATGSRPPCRWNCLSFSLDTRCRPNRSGRSAEDCERRPGISATHQGEALLPVWRNTLKSSDKVKPRTQARQSQASHFPGSESRHARFATFRRPTCLRRHMIHPSNYGEDTLAAGQRQVNDSVS
jgi:hypothetical protein